MLARQGDEIPSSRRTFALAQSDSAINSLIMHLMYTLNEEGNRVYTLKVNLPERRPKLRKC
jgi:hypothetical protein